MASTFRSLREPNYRNWFGGALISNTGMWMQRTAQDWIVLTALTDNDATALGITMALQLGPQLFLFPVGGAIADRFDKRRLLIVTQVLMGCAGFLLFGLTIAGVIHLGHVYALALALGIIATIDAPVRQAFVSELVGEHLLPNAVSLNSASFNSARLLGPAIAGVLTASLGAGAVFLISGIGFAATVTVLLTLDRARLHPAKAKGAQRGIMGGFRYIRTRPDVIVIMVIVGVVATFAVNFNIYTATMARMEFGKDAGAFGLLNSILAVGSLSGALVAARREKARLRVVFWCSGGVGLACLLAGLMPTYGSFAVSLSLLGFMTITMFTTANAYIQTTTPSWYRGRVMSIYAAVLMGGAPIGAPLAGWVANSAGPRAALFVGAASGLVGILIGAVWMFSAKHLRVHYVSHSRRFLHLTYDGRQPTFWAGPLRNRRNDRPFGGARMPERTRITFDDDAPPFV